MAVSEAGRNYASWLKMDRSEMLYPDSRTLLVDAIDTERIAGGESQINLQGEKGNFANLLANIGSEYDKRNRESYDTEFSVETYRNYLDWLFATFETDELEFRKSCIDILELKAGDKVLITGCGLGEEVEICCETVGASGVVHGQDLSALFIEHASEKTQHANSVYTISSALDLPYREGYFDAVFHFGGINLFGDVRIAVSEMNRVCRIGGKVVFGDESVAQHLRATDYGKMVIKNNALWKSPLPLDQLPIEASSIIIKYVLGNCFYIIGFKKNKHLPSINIDVPHVGYRGGSIRTRFFGELEGVKIETKLKIYNYAKDNNTSVHDVLNNIINNQLK